MLLLGPVGEWRTGTDQLILGKARHLAKAFAHLTDAARAIHHAETVAERAQQRAGVALPARQLGLRRLQRRDVVGDHVPLAFRAVTGPGQPPMRAVRMPAANLEPLEAAGPPHRAQSAPLVIGVLRVDELDRVGADEVPIAPAQRAPPCRIDHLDATVVPDHTQQVVREHPQLLQTGEDVAAAGTAGCLVRPMRADAPCPGASIRIQQICLIRHNRGIGR
jgi:hypothetical protein